MSHVKRGLVLEGGGAKGAYAFGCLQAFREAEIKFDAVAGTSVGGLNAVLWAADQMELGGKYWSELRPGRVFRWRLIGFLALPLFALRWLVFASTRWTAAAQLELGTMWGEFLRKSAAWVAFIALGWIAFKVTDWDFFNTYVSDLAFGIAITGRWAIFQTVSCVLDRAGITLLAPPTTSKSSQSCASWRGSSKPGIRDAC